MSNLSNEEIEIQFEELIEALNAMDIEKWSSFYSDNMLSAIAGTDFFDSKTNFVDAISKNFEARSNQNIESQTKSINTIDSNLALLTSQNKVKFTLKDNTTFDGKHIFSLIWKKEDDGWKIIVSHESWSSE
ncbi:nuclear transport factor 2 family protein [Candidatus Woesearchaeota archaeon]|nr:nuclear transport factor 2 family protein [Candidatus Woesearchaeota archaeon]